MSGVVNFVGGLVPSRTSNPPHPAATRIADWSDGNVFAASRYDLTGRRVDLAFWPVSSDAGGQWVPPSHGGLIRANALADAGGCGGGCPPCDMNCDGGIDALDIEPFLGCLFP